MSDKQRGTPSTDGQGLGDIHGMQRRQMLRSIAASAGLATLGSTLLTACGGGGDGEGPTAAAAGDKNAQAAPKPRLDAPTLACGTATENTLTLLITAGASGAPAGFSVQWMTCADLAANNGVWYDSSDPRLCKASFSGNANGTQWNLGPNGQTSVVIGGLNDTDPGVSYTCNGPLGCATCYVFRSFAHATNQSLRSNFSANHTCTTGSCEIPPLTDGAYCTKSQGYFGVDGTGQGGLTPPNNGSWDAVNCALAALGGSAVIGGPNRSATFTTQSAVSAYLPGGGTPGPLTGTTVDTAPAGGGNLAAQTLALTLNIALSGSGCAAGTCAETGYPAGYGSLTLCRFEAGDTWMNDATTISAATAAALNGQTVGQVLAAANAYLDGGPLPYALASAGQLNQLVDNLNLAFDGSYTTAGGASCACGGISAFAQSHLCPA